MRKRPSLGAVVVGVRPQYIKAAALWHIAQQHPQRLKLRFLDTGQHYSRGMVPGDLVPGDPVLYSHRLKHVNSDPLQMVGRALIWVGEHLRAWKNEVDFTLVVGDANPTLVGALAAAKVGIPVVHLEAGARRDPTEQEEINRRVADHVAGLRLCTTPRNLETLAEEGLGVDSVWVGDLFRPYLLRIGRNRHPESGGEGAPIVFTCHRPQNLSLWKLRMVMVELSKTGRPIWWVVHPRAEKLAAEAKRGLEHVMLFDPLSFERMVRAVEDCSYVVTDSGGLIREAHHFKKRVLVLREIGGWDELIGLGANKRVTFTVPCIREAIEWIESLPQDSYPEETPFVRENGVEVALAALEKFCGLE